MRSFLILLLLGSFCLPALHPCRAFIPKKFQTVEKKTFSETIFQKKKDKKYVSYPASGDWEGILCINPVTALSFLWPLNLREIL